MTQQSTLPEELWLNVFAQFRQDHLSPRPFISAHIAALHALCEVSHQFRRLAQPILFESQKLDGTVASGKFISTVCQRSGLAKMVRFLSVSASYRAVSAFEDYGSIQTTIEVFEEAISPSLPANLSQEILEGVEDRTFDASLALALAVMPNLEYLCLRIAVPLPLTFDVIRHTVLCTLPGRKFPQRDNEQASGIHFAKLNNLELHYHETCRGGDMRFWTAPSLLRRLPSLKVFKASLDDWANPAPAELEGGALGLEVLQLTRTGVRPPDLTALVSLCPDLRKIFVDWWMDDPTTYESFDFSTMGDALRRRGDGMHRLEQLVLDPGMYCFTENVRPLGVLGSLRELRHLRSLCTHWDFLVDASVVAWGVEHEGDPDDTKLARLLPECLEKLYLGGPLDYPQDFDLLCVVLGSPRFARLYEVSIFLRAEERCQREVAQRILDSGWSSPWDDIEDCGEVDLDQISVMISHLSLNRTVRGS
ncbi:hypothetical protein BX600DRAFT_60116 [Xylariales sp. PMI_506]|nr:hypothetical protein BX600DRAFT_60116 [Xylariales sp. PMI_506]